MWWAHRCVGRPSVGGGGWRCSGWRATAAFLSWPVWIGPLAMTLVAVVLLRARQRQRSTGCDTLAIALAPIAIIARGARRRPCLAAPVSRARRVAVVTPSAATMGGRSSRSERGTRSRRSNAVPHRAVLIAAIGLQAAALFVLAPCQRRAYAVLVAEDVLSRGLSAGRRRRRVRRLGASTRATGNRPQPTRSRGRRCSSSGSASCVNSLLRHGQARRSPIAERCRTLGAQAADPANVSTISSRTTTRRTGCISPSSATPGPHRGP